MDKMDYMNPILIANIIAKKHNPLCIYYLYMGEYWVISSLLHLIFLLMQESDQCMHNHVEESISHKICTRCLSFALFCLYNSLTPGRAERDFEIAIFSLNLVIGMFGSPYDDGHRWMPQDLIDDKSTLVQVMAWANVDRHLTRYM